jgi:cytochrome c biogenesis protein CcmG, thiol:disulfide interchange protein DsbE
MTRERRTEATMTAGATARRGPRLRRLPLPVLVVAAVTPLVLLAALVIVLAARLPTVSPTAPGAAAPDFTLTGLDGEPIALADLRGHPVVVNFWASWCGPCVEEFPLLRDAAARHADSGLVVVGIVNEDRVESALRFMADHGATWSAAMDPGGRVAAAYGILGVPETYFIDRDGRIAARQIGQFTAASLEEKLAAITGSE